MNLLETLENPAMMHAASVHMPIALSILGFLLILACGLAHRSRSMRVAAVIAYGVLAASAYAAVKTGEQALEAVPNTLPAEVWTLIDHHQEMAERIWLVALATMGLLMLSMFRQAELRKAMLLLSSVMGVITLIIVSLTAHYGGSLVYQHGVGTPMMDIETRAPDAIEDPEGVVDATPAPDLVPVRPIDMDAARAVSYTRDIQPIFAQHCIECHAPPTLDGDFDMSSVSAMKLAGSKAGPGVIPGNADESAVVQYIRGVKQPRMPHRRDALDEEELHLIRMWIQAGAEDDGAPVEDADDQPAEDAAFDPLGGGDSAESPAFDPLGGGAPAPDASSESVFDPLAG